MESLEKNANERVTLSETAVIDAAVEDLKKEFEDVLTPKKKHKFLKALAQGSLAAILGFTLNHIYQFRDKVDEIDNNGSIEYKHSDKETEHILNVFSGKEKLNEKEIERILRACIISWSHTQKVLIPDNIDKFTLAELKKFSEDNLKPLDNMTPVDYIKVNYEESYFMENTYKTLWTLEEKSGSPYIRWDDTDLITPLLDVNKHRAHYNPNTNTIYINPEDLKLDLSSNYISELAHAQQFSNNAIISYTTGIKDVLKTAVNSLSEPGGFKIEYSKLYNTPGSLEYDAHEVREESLKKEVEKARTKDYKGIARQN